MDAELVKRGLAKSREAAVHAIENGEVIVTLGTTATTTAKPMAMKMAGAGFPGLGNRYLVDFGSWKVKLDFTVPGKLTYTGVKADGSDGGSETVDIEVVEVRDSIVIVRWQEADKTSVVHIEDYGAMKIWTNVVSPPDFTLDPYAGTFQEI